MFKWRYETSYEVEVPILPLWNFSTEPSNWPKWIDLFESCKFDEKDSNIVQIKFKNRDIYFPVIITKMDPPKEVHLLLKNFFMTQENQTTIQEISPTHSKVITCVTFTSFLTPFLKSYFRKHLDKQTKKFMEVLATSEI